MLLPISDEPIKGEDARRNEIMWFEQIKVL